MSWRSSTQSASPAQRGALLGDGLKHVPPDPAQRLQIRQAAEAEARQLPADCPPSRQALRQMGDRLLQRLELEGRWLGFAMVMVSNAFWAKHLQAVPFARRLLLLPRCLRNVQPVGLACPTDAVMARSFHELDSRARELGYQTLVADGMPIVVKTLARKGVEGIIGVACMDSLAVAYERIWQLGVPAVAVPLLDGRCHDTCVDMDWVSQYVEAYQPAATRPGSGYLGLMQSAKEMFEPTRLSQLLEPVAPAGQDGALGATWAIARDWLAAGGKRLRPFVTLAAASALRAKPNDGALSEEAYRVALAIEAFHKASLVHDDIEDDDDERYGQPTLHRRYGLSTAINIGDYLLGLGYRLIAAAGQQCSAATATALLAQMSRAHMLLAQGQGAELAWRSENQIAPPPADVLKVYALKTAPAFEAALAGGMLLGSAAAAELDRLRTFARDVGVAFQILNDLDDWADDCQAARPTYLTALALASIKPADRAGLTQRIARCGESPAALAALRAEFDALGVFDQARTLLDRLRQRSVELAGRFSPARLSELCSFLVELILSVQGDAPDPASPS